MSLETRMLLGLFIGIVTMIILVLKTKTHTFIALLFAALITGLIGGMTPAKAIAAIQDGFGNTLKSTGIIIGLGVMMGGILEKSGGAEKLAYSFIRFIGKKREEWALAVTGWVVAIPVFADSAIIILAPLAKAISRVSGKSVIGLALAMAAGLQLTHSLVPPTPGPLAAAGLLSVDVGQMILMGMAISIPMLIAGVLYSKWLGRNIYQIAHVDGTFERKDFKEEYLKTMGELDSVMSEKKLPSFWMSLAPIAVPLILIFMKTIADLLKLKPGLLSDIITLIGAPIVALGVGTTIAVYGLAKRSSKKEVMKVMDDGIKSTGIIMLITGAGGSLGYVIKVSGIGDVLGRVIADLPIAAVLIPFTIAALMRIALGSATVAIITAASLTVPLVGVLHVNPLLLAQASCVGAISFSYFNDSGFWVFNGMFGLTEIKDQLKAKFAVSMIMSIVGLIELLILGFFMK